MCITVSDAHLSQTVIGVWDIQHPRWGYRHVLAYQNAAENLSDGPNCMLLHVPTAEPIRPEHVVDTSAPGVSDFLMRMAALRFVGVRSARMPENHVFEMGIYHIAVLNKPEECGSVLERIPERKRPNIPERTSIFTGNISPAIRFCSVVSTARTKPKARPLWYIMRP